ncbi:RNA-binding transcriptional accessory protein [Sphingobacterium alkalisoli]|uniref:RNA-binding transcriptional accessory protein n=1 Tax=Sphingobacterium alkalisoli TaxID=1874115 RepID=A0A4U0GPN9_9SPHI|nr:Tex family protein [Sphingobacterium alkalisoli]TJY60778.1 RNA-binding transcriptional accessory protein [Sphingobacterium alkalisoli]GGH31875.1 RNA-binding transcriptional accessory protein [Sphingobacterium alkalisoli]
MLHEITISKELALTTKQVSITIGLLDEGATVPFISRYRKELTGSLDEVQIMSVRDRVQQLRELDKRKDAVLRSIMDQGKLTSELEKQIEAAETMSELEDIYLPYKPKRKTRASVAREKGLQPLADVLLEQKSNELEDHAISFVDAEKGVSSAEEALAGARDIIAEIIAEDADIRARMRKIFLEKGTFVSRVVPGKEESALKYKDYYEWSELLKDAPSHRVLAMRRGEKEEYLYFDIEVSEELTLPIIDDFYIKGNNEAAKQVRLAILDGYKRLLRPSIETEVRVLTRQKADQEAIKVFTDNVRQLLLAAPLGQRRLLAIDPGFRTGCKTVVLDAQGNLLENTTIFPHTGSGGLMEAEKTVKHLISKYDIEAIAVGNGTAGRETEDFIRKLGLQNVMLVMVNESGASIYSASETAREEFPDYDITVRGAVSIGRRLMDPLAELVKIDPKSIGVGQYQHDVDQNKLQTALDDTVMSCVNAVGVELNTASKEILSYVSGLGPSLAQQIVNYRKENGPFSSRRDLKKVPRLGDKAFEQAAGFLRIRNASHPLDGSAVHPERYALVEQMAKDLDVEVSDLIRNEKMRKQINLKPYITDEVGLPTLNDILMELAKPGLDPREQFEAFSFTDGVNSIADLRTGMKLPGIVTNITNFGAFVDIGVHQDGLVHLSQLSNRFVSDPHEIVKVQQHVMVTVTEVDAKRSRIGLSMKTAEKVLPQKRNQNLSPISDKTQGTDMGAKLAALASKFK